MAGQKVYPPVALRRFTSRRSSIGLTMRWPIAAGDWCAAIRCNCIRSEATSGRAYCRRGLVRRDQGQRAAALADFHACQAQAQDSLLARGAAEQVQALTAP